jgi:hypothetical protein
MRGTLWQPLRFQTKADQETGRPESMNRGAPERHLRPNDCFLNLHGSRHDFWGKSKNTITRTHSETRD